MEIEIKKQLLYQNAMSSYTPMMLCGKKNPVRETRTKAWRIMLHSQGNSLLSETIPVRETRTRAWVI